jgi:hypothetical protein
LSDSFKTLRILWTSGVLTEEENKDTEQNLQRNFSKGSQNEMKICAVDIKVEPTPAD